MGCKPFADALAPPPLPPQVLTWDLPEVGLDRAEGVVLSGGLRVLHERIEERRLADVRQPHQPRLQAAGRGAAGSAAREEAGTASEHWEGVRGTTR